jgi:hypothetical protein
MGIGVLVDVDVDYGTMMVTLRTLGNDGPDIRGEGGYKNSKKHFFGGRVGWSLGSHRNLAR